MRLPVAAGSNVTLITQPEFAATLFPQVFVCAKSAGLAPVMVIELKASGCKRLFFRVTFIARLDGPTVSLDSQSNPTSEYEVIAGAVGTGAATEFSAFLRMFRELPNLDGR